MLKLNLFLIELITIWSVFSLTNGKIINCYFSNWVSYRPGDGAFNPENIDPHLCTHLSYSFFGFEPSGKLKSLDSWKDIDSGHIKKTMNLKKINPNLKVILVVGGWTFGSQTFSDMAGNASKRKLFISSTLQFVKEHEFDGVDIDWEYPVQRGGKPSDKKNFVILLKELNAALKASNKELGIAVAAGGESARQSYDIPNIVKHVDFINVMTYDFAGTWDGVVGFSAPFKGQGSRNAEASINYWLQQGAPASKLLLGLPFYGRTFKLANSQKYSLGSPITGAGTAGPFTRENGFLGYNEICAIKNNWSYEWSTECHAPFLHNSEQLITYDDEKSIGEKVDFANSLNLGGVMIWSIDTDDFHGKCNGEKFPLLKTINKRISNQPSTVNHVNFNTQNKPSEEHNNDEDNYDEGYYEQSVPSKPKAAGKTDCAVDGLYAHDSDCKLFYQCHQGIRYEQHCPQNLHFDDSAKVCNYPEAANCALI